MSQDLTASPDLFPFAIDVRADMVLFVRMTEADYAAASFLDMRMLGSRAAGEWKSWPQVRDAAAGFAPRCHFIFHISHVGSTLLSRLLGLLPACLSLREPAILRKLGEIYPGLGGATSPWRRDDFDERARTFLALWSRTFRPGQTAVIKATSVVSEMAERLVEQVADSRAVLMHVGARTFLRTLLGGAMSDISQNAAARLARLHQRLGGEHWRLADLSDGERVAMSWLCERLALSAAAKRFSDRTLWLDFDRFLADPARWLAAVVRHFGTGANDATIKAMVASPIMRQYAKAPEYAYNAQFREQVLQHREQKSAAEIEKGLTWLARCAEAIPAVAAELAEDTHSLPE